MTRSGPSVRTRSKCYQRRPHAFRPLHEAIPLGQHCLQSQCTEVCTQGAPSRDEAHPSLHARRHPLRLSKRSGRCATSSPMRCLTLRVTRLLKIASNQGVTLGHQLGGKRWSFAKTPVPGVCPAERDKLQSACSAKVSLGKASGSARTSAAESQTSKTTS